MALTHYIAHFQGMVGLVLKRQGASKTPLISFLPLNPLGTSPGAGLESAFDQADAAFAGDVVRGAIDMSRPSFLFFVDIYIFVA